MIEGPGGHGQGEGALHQLLGQPGGLPLELADTDLWVNAGEGLEHVGQEPVD